MADAVISELKKIYPNLSNRDLPQFIRCVHEHNKVEAKQGFQRVCYSKVRIVEVEPVKGTKCPRCIWRVYYELKHDDPELQIDDTSNSSGDMLPPNLPTNDESLKKLLANITAGAIEFLDMKVIRKCLSENDLTAIVEFSPQCCTCTCRDFNMAIEHLVSGQKLEVTMALSQIKIADM